MWGGGSPGARPLFFVSPKKRGKRKATRAARSALRADCPVLLESQGRHGMARRLRRRLAVAESSLTFCDARRAVGVVRADAVSMATHPLLRHARAGGHPGCCAWRGA